MTTSSAASLMWSDSLLLGFDPMDHVHEEFVALVGALQHALADALLSSLDALLLNARAHFGAEDSWMAETAFPARACHEAEHAAVLRSIEGVRARVARGDQAPARTLARELVKWFPAHADYLDSALAQWICQKRLGGKPVVLRRSMAKLLAPDVPGRRQPLETLTC